jgi:hypothetical protein
VRRRARSAAGVGAPPLRRCGLLWCPTGGAAPAGGSRSGPPRPGFCLERAARARRRGASSGGAAAAGLQPGAGELRRAGRRAGGHRLRPGRGAGGVLARARRGRARVPGPGGHAGGPCPYPMLCRACIPVGSPRQEPQHYSRTWRSGRWPLYITSIRVRAPRVAAGCLPSALLHMQLRRSTPALLQTRCTVARYLWTRPGSGRTPVIRPCANVCLLL